MTKQICLHPPTTFLDIVREVSLQIARKYLFFPLYRKVAVYCFLVTILSVFASIFSLPLDIYWTQNRSILILQKHNVINLLFVKYGWGWTFLLTSLFIYFTSSVYNCGRNFSVFCHLSRLVVGTFIWYLSTSWFVHLEKTTAVCYNSKASSRDQCALSGGKWITGFDISGHCFLLIYCSLLICEETQAFRDWDKLRILLENTPGHPSAFTWVSAEELKIGLSNHRLYTSYIKILFIFLFLLHLIWDWSLIITVLYYHTIPHKISGALVALVAWIISYRIGFPFLKFPALPGQGCIHYQN